MGEETAFLFPSLGPTCTSTRLIRSLSFKLGQQWTQDSTVFIIIDKLQSANKVTSVANIIFTNILFKN